MKLELEGIIYEAKESATDDDNILYEMVKKKTGNSLALYVDGKEVGLLPSNSREIFLEYVVRNHQYGKLFPLRSAGSDEEIIDLVNTIYENGRRKGEDNRL